MYTSTSKCEISINSNHQLEAFFFFFHFRPPFVCMCVCAFLVLCVFPLSSYLLHVMEIYTWEFNMITSSTTKKYIAALWSYSNRSRNGTSLTYEKWIRHSRTFSHVEALRLCFLSGFIDYFFFFTHKNLWMYFLANVSIEFKII